MAEPLSRREALKRLGAYGAAISMGPATLDSRLSTLAGLTVAGEPVEISVRSLSALTARITLNPIRNGVTTPVPVTGQLLREEMGTRVAASTGGQALKAGNLRLRISESPPSVIVEDGKGNVLQHFMFDAVNPGISFMLGKGPLLGLGEGGPQFDRKGTSDRMIIGQGGYRLATNGTRAPVQWLIGTAEGWAFFIHQPFGAFDFTGSVGKFTPPASRALPLDLFVTASTDPALILREYASHGLKPGLGRTSAEALLISESWVMVRERSPSRDRFSGTSGARVL